MYNIGYKKHPNAIKHILIRNRKDALKEKEVLKYETKRN